MDFSFSEEQQMLRDSARRFISERYDFEQRKKVRASSDGWSRELWLQLGELGLLSINIPAEDGGIGAGPVGTMLISNVVGEGMLLEPFLSSAVVATQAIAQIGSGEQRRRWLPAMATGELIAVLAHDEPGGSLDPMEIEATAAKTADGWRISGSKSLVYHAPAADLLLVSARIGGELGLFAVPADSPGVTLSSCTTVDDQRAADIILKDVHVSGQERLGAGVSDSLQAVLDYGLAALCAEAFGCMDRIFSATTAYSRSRLQFGVPIASFQALQHRMADMLMHLEQSRSMSYLATSRCTDSDPRSRRESLSAAKALMGQAARYIGQQAVQLHGGMGMTDELDVSHYFKRLLAFELRYGTTDRHLESYRRTLS
jgi:alkylation response protein AidB-like acyl-CoA dehydrogenase